MKLKEMQDKMIELVGIGFEIDRLLEQRLIEIDNLIADKTKIEIKNICIVKNMSLEGAFLRIEKLLKTKRLFEDLDIEEKKVIFGYLFKAKEYSEQCIKEVVK